MYSKIPMPYSDWSKENMRYTMGFFPIVGLVIGGSVWGWAYLADFLGLTQENLFRVCIMTAIPLLITGGIHLDGFLDTSDALSSWQEKERRLEILKDSHAGAFAIICCGIYLVLYLGSVSVIPKEHFLTLGIGFLFIRAFSGYSVVTFKMAKNTGLAATFSSAAQKKAVAIWMVVYLVAGGAAMIAFWPVGGTACVVVILCVFFYYRHMAYKNFGGINGDLAGWFLQVAEAAMMLAAAITVLTGK